MLLFTGNSYFSANTPCPNSEDPDGDETKYFTSTYEKMMCPYGSVWKQKLCTCVFSTWQHLVTLTLFCALTFTHATLYEATEVDDVV